jgi:hypothetical protein
MSFIAARTPDFFVSEDGGRLWFQHDDHGHVDFQTVTGGTTSFYDILEVVRALEGGGLPYLVGMCFTSLSCVYEMQDMAFRLCDLDLGRWTSAAIFQQAGRYPHNRASGRKRVALESHGAHTTGLSLLFAFAEALPAMLACMLLPEEAVLLDLKPLQSC